MDRRIGRKFREDTRSTRGEPDPVKYKEVYDLWIKSYGKIFDDLLTLPFRENSDSFVQISKLWKESYTRLYGQWNGSIQKLYEKSAEISKGNASPDVYKEYADIFTRGWTKSSPSPAVST